MTGNAALRIAVTGASGFVGRALLRAGAEAGHAMIAVSRQRPDGAAEFRAIAGLDDAAGLARAFAGVDAVAHCAARVHVMHHEGADALARFRAVNVIGTRAVLTAAQGAGAKALAVLSTAKVLGEGTGGRALRDSDPLAPEGAYARSKAEAEELVAREAGALPWCVVRPPLVYGPGVGGNFRRLLRLADLAATVPIPLGGVRNGRSLVYVDNLCDAILRVLTDQRAHRGRFLVSDGAPVSTADLLRRIGEARGRATRLVRVPPALLRTALRLVGRGAEAERLLESFTVDDSAIRTTLGWSPPVTPAEGVARTVRWWAEHAR